MTEDQTTTPTSAGTSTPVPHAFTVRSFRHLWFNNVAFMVAANAQRFVFGWFVLDGINGTESDQGLVVFALGLPAILLTLHAGAWADRWDRKRIMLGSQIASAIAMAAAMILVRSGEADLKSILALSVLAGAASTIGQPVRQALVPELVSREQLYSAIAMNAIAATLSLISGAALARLFGTIWGFPGAFGFLLGLFLIGLIPLAALKVPDHAERPERRSIRVETSEAVGFLYRDRSLRKLIGLLMLAGLTINPLFMVMMQAHVKEGLGRNSGDAALPFALVGIGIAASSIIVMRKGDMANKGAAFMRAFMVGGTVVMLMGRTTQLWQLTALALVMGMAGGFYINMNQGLIQARTPQALMGRVMGVYTLLQIGVIPISALTYGLIADQIGTGDTMTLGSAAGVLVVLAVYLSDPEFRSIS